MNIIYISYDGMTDALGQSQVIPYLIGLTKRGHHFSIVSSEKSDKFLLEKNKVAQLLEIHSIEWFPVPYGDTQSLFSKQKNITILKEKATELCKLNKPDAVHCRSYMAALIGLELKRKFDVKFIFDMRGFWADERLDGAIWNKKNLVQRMLYNYFKKKEIEFLKAADYTISLTENAKNEITSWQTLKKSPAIEVIPCCVDLELFSSKGIDFQTQQKLKKELTISDTDFVISYLGSIGTWYMLDEMLDFFKALLAKRENAKFLIITPDQRESIFSKAMKKEIPLEKIIIKSVTREQVPLYLSLSKISIYFIKPLYSKKASSPTKTGEIMAMGIPIITNKNIGDSDTLIADSGVGILVNDFSNTEYERVINAIDGLLQIDKNKITQVANDYYSLEKGVDLYSRVYERIEKHE